MRTGIVVDSACELPRNFSTSATHIGQKLDTPWICTGHGGSGALSLTRAAASHRIQ